ncbi:hypothetical protein RB595_009621 [Gaeumannomyces hyphopodioides]
MTTLPPAPGVPTPAPVPPASEPESPADIITLENLALKLAKWDPAAASHLYALVDMGSNGIRFSVSDLTPSRARLLPCLYQERAPISLLDALLEGDPSTAGHGSANEPKAQDKFPEATILAVARTLARFRAIALDGYRVPPENLLVFATEAMRRASNAADMLKAIADAAPGTVVHILEPKVETLLGAMGARSSFVNVRGLFVDLGGGSLQISYLNSEPDRVSSTAGAVAIGPADAESSSYGVAAARAGQSMPFGAARMTHIIEHESSHALDVEVSGLHSKLAAAVEHLRRVHPALTADLADDGPGVGLYLYGGGLRGYGSMLMFNDDIEPYPLAGIGSYSVSGRYFAEVKKMRKVNKKHKDKIPGMSGRRRQQFPAIATVAEALAAVVPNIRWATFCAGGNREGALMMVLPVSLRESNPLQFLSRHNDNGTVGNPESPPSAGFSGLARGPAAESLTATLIEALTESLAGGPSCANVFSLGLGSLFIEGLWSAASGSSGDDDESASGVLHQTLGRDPGTPGLGHLERAVLAVTLVSRWGGSVCASDKPLLEKLRAVVASTQIRLGGAGGTDSQSKGSGSASGSLFWADYIGAAAAALARVTAAYPCDLVAGGPPRIRFRASSETKLGKENINLAIDVALPDVLAFDLADLAVPFKKLGKKEGKKVTATVQIVPPWV